MTGGDICGLAVIAVIGLSVVLSYVSSMWDSYQERKLEEARHRGFAYKAQEKKAQQTRESPDE